MFTVLCRHAHSYWQSIEAFVYGIGKSNVTKHGNILLSLTLKENTISNSFAIYILYKYLPKKESTHKKCTELSLERKKGIGGTIYIDVLGKLKYLPVLILGGVVVFYD